MSETSRGKEVELNDPKDIARDFFSNLRTYYVRLLNRYPGRSRVRWWHRWLGLQPRGILYKWMVENADNALGAIQSNDINALVRVIDDLIEWYQSELDRFDSSILEVSTNIGIREMIHDLTRLRDDLLDKETI